MNIKSLSLTMFFAIAFSSFGAPAEDITTVKPIEGTFINLPYQDVRNKYTNNIDIDYTSPELWDAKIDEMADMGMKYLIFMSVANEGMAYYPSKLMPWRYPADSKSPVDAIMDAAARHGMMVFMSTGWAKDQDDNLRDPATKQRQLDMIDELAALYGSHPAMYGWYLPVEDCLGPVLTQHAVDAVNALTEKAHKLTPGKKILISPYGIYNSDFANPEYEKQLAKLKVDIIAYQDEVGCVREQFPMTRLRENWKHLSDIHSRIGIEMWANCETFAWEGNTNDRTSALIPAAYPRLLAQQAAASKVGVKNIISFMILGIFETPDSRFQLGQPHWSDEAYEQYMDWKAGDRRWKLLENTFLGQVRNNAPKATSIAVDGNAVPALLDGITGEENTNDTAWNAFESGKHEIVLDLGAATDINEVMVRFLDYNMAAIDAPEKMHLLVSADGKKYDMFSIKDALKYPNDRHDAWADVILFDNLKASGRYVKILFNTTTKVMIDEVFVNPTIATK